MVRLEELRVLHKQRQLLPAEWDEVQVLYDLTRLAPEGGGTKP